MTNALNHVCMWKNGEWCPVSVQEARKIHPGGTVSSGSGLFMCDLCGQYVSFTDGEIRERYFKHARNNEISQNCPDYTANTSGNNQTPYDPQKHDLPIRIVIKKDYFELEIGFPPLPNNLLNFESIYKINIKPDRYSEISDVIRCQCVKQENEYEYLLSRFKNAGATYLSVGSFVASSYRVLIKSENNKLIDSSGIRTIWPACIHGIKSDAIFDGETKKMIPYDSYIRTNTKYYMITDKLRFSDSSVSLNKLFFSCRNRYYLYELIIKDTSEKSARFLLDLRYRLDDKACLMMPVWPAIVNTPTIILRPKGTIYFYARGNAEIKTFPSTNLYKECTNNNHSSSHVIECKLSDKNQLVAAGRINVLNLAYLWENDLNIETPVPKIKVYDLNHEDMHSGDYSSLPRQNEFTILSNFDGIVEIKKNTHVIRKYDLKAGINLIVNDLKFGITVNVYVGLDIVWGVSYVRSANIANCDDDELYTKLIHCKGDPVRVSHSIGALVHRLCNYPKTRQWFCNAMRLGIIDSKAIAILKHTLV